MKLIYTNEGKTESLEIVPGDESTLYDEKIRILEAEMEDFRLMVKYEVLESKRYPGNVGGQFNLDHDTRQDFLHEYIKAHPRRYDNGLARETGEAKGRLRAMVTT